MKAGFVGLVGLPNAGKSTLLNALVGEKVGIVTNKSQTTRKSVSGVLSSEEGQVIFIDAPGFVRAEKGLNAFLKEEVERVMQKSDVLICLLNIDHQNPERLLSVARSVAKFTKRSSKKEKSKPWVIAFSKCDLKKSHRIAHLQRLLKEEGLSDIPQISLSATEDDLKNLRLKLLKVIWPFLQESEQPLFDVDLFTTQTSRNLVSEVIREKCFEYLEDEIPYGLCIDVRKYDESRPEIVKLNADIIVSKTGHRPIVVGHKGTKIKQIGSEARKDLENMFGQKFYLELFVKVKPNWSKKAEGLEEFGYVCKK